MSNQRYDLTRRKVLGSLGVIGAGAALGGAGTMAFFSDEENFEGNKLVAGELDLKVDWEEHYSDWSADENDDRTDDSGGQESNTQLDDDAPYDFEVLMLAPGETAPSGHTTFPTCARVEQDHRIAIPDMFVDDFMDNTSVEAYPDTNDDGIQDLPTGWDDPTSDNYVCNLGADTPEDLDPRSPDYDGAGTGLRTKNDDTWVDLNGDGYKQIAPLINIDDVKPGDFGELTLSFHLCDNDGFVWLNGELTADDEVSVSESEGKDPDEDSTQDDPNDLFDGELAHEIRTCLWLDDGDNIYEPGDGEQAIQVNLRLDELMQLLETDGLGIPLHELHNDGLVVVPPTGSGDCPPDQDPNAPEYDSTHTTGDVVTVADGPDDDDQPDSLTISKNPKCTDFGLFEALKTDEATEGQLPFDGSTKTYSTDYGDIHVTSDTVDGVEQVTGWEIDPVDSDTQFCVAKVIVKGGNEGANVYSYDNATGVDDFTDDPDDLGMLSDFGTDLQTPTGQEISHVDFCVQATTPRNGDGNGDDGKCFVASNTHYVGFEWWLPVDHANEIQTDSVMFDLGFYTEQCRHNDGSGMPRANSA